MKNAMKLKAMIKKISYDKKVSAQLVLQNYMLERFLERLSLSVYRKHFILKGGFLIGSMAGLDSRTTMDLDATIKEYPVTMETITKMINDIILIDIDDNVNFVLNGIGNIRDSDEYNGYRVSLQANYGKISVPIKLDITTGDCITPKEIEYGHKLMMEDRYLNVMAYNISTILAEKIETIISRGDQNTRMRDFYDVYLLFKLNSANAKVKLTGQAIIETAKHRGSLNLMKQYSEIVQTIKNSKEMKIRWNNYKKENSYTQTIEFEDTCQVIAEILSCILPE